MFHRTNPVVLLGAFFDACCLWRVYMPHHNLPGSQFRCFAMKPDYDVLATNEACVVQRCCTKPQYEFLKVMRKLGLKIIYDLDDHFWDIPKFNPAYQVLNAYKQGFVACMQWTDVITVSTRHLKKVVERQLKVIGNKNAEGQPLPVIVAENRIDLRLFAPSAKSDKVIVGWAGSSSHAGDLAIAAPGLKECAREFPDVTFEFRGMEPPEELRHLPNLQFKLWTPVAEFGARMPRWGWSIALAPLVDHDFNQSKSAIKLYESAFCRIPTLASWVESYDRFYSFDPELRWLLCAGPGNWAPKIRELINDPARRDDLGNRAYKVLVDNYAFNKPHEGWIEAFQAVGL